MTTIDLTPSQTAILTALVNSHRKMETAVKGEEIAEKVDRNPGTIRNQMQSLKALQVVEGVPGPKGGYKPTAKAYEVLDLQELEDSADIPLIHDGESVPDANIDEIDLTSVHHPERCRAEIHIQGSIADFQNGDTVVVGPTPLSDLVIEGTVDGRDDTNHILILKIDDMEAPAETV